MRIKSPGKGVNGVVSNDERKRASGVVERGRREGLNKREGAERASGKIEKGRV